MLGPRAAVGAPESLARPGAREIVPPVTVSFTVDGQPITCPEGLTVAAALLHAGRTCLRETPRLRAPRSLFCGMGVCFDCVMEIDGRPGVRACVTIARDGMRVVTLNGAPRLGRLA